MLFEHKGRQVGLGLAAAFALVAAGAWAQDDDYLFYNWNIDLQASRPYAQGGISWGNSLQERVVPPRKALLDESIQYRLAVGRRFQFDRKSSRAWHLAASAEYYKGEVDKYGVLVDRNGSLYSGSSFFASWPTPTPPPPSADGDEYHDVFGLGELTRTPLSLSLTREFRVRKSLRPYVGATAGYVRSKWKDFDPSATLALLNPQFGAGEQCSNAGETFLFGLCRTSGSDPETSAILMEIHNIVSALPAPFTGSCLPGDPCVIPPAMISAEAENGMEYGFFMGVNLQFGKKQRWGFNTQARYMWSQAPVKVSVTHPLKDVNTCLDPQSSYTLDCLVQVSGEEVWIKTNIYDGVTGDSEFRFWQFKGGEISQDRWELFMGVRYLFGKRHARRAE